MEDFATWLRALFISVLSSLLVILGVSGCSQEGEGMTSRDIAAMAIIAGATSADATFQVQNHPGEIGMTQGFYLDSGVDIATTLRFSGKEVDQDTLFELVKLLGEPVNTNGT